MSETATTAAAHWSAVGAEVERLEAAGASASEVTAELARRWSAWARYRLWDEYPAETAARAEMVLSAVLHHLYLPGGEPLAEFPVDRRALVRWGVVETVRDGGLALRDLAVVGALGLGARGYRQQWRVPADAVCPPPAVSLDAATVMEQLGPGVTLVHYDDTDGTVEYLDAAGELMVDGLDIGGDGWTAPDAWTLPDSPGPVFAEYGPLAWSVWASLPLSGTVDLEAVADALSMDEPWIAEVLEVLSGSGLADASLSVGGGWFRRSVEDAAAGAWCNRAGEWCVAADMRDMLEAAAGE